MNEPVIAFVGVVIAALISVVGVVYVQRSTSSLRKATALSTHNTEIKRLEAEAYERARESYEAAIRRYQGELQEMRGYINSTEDRHARITQDLTSRVEVAEAQARQCMTRVMQLEGELRKHDIPVPTHLGLI